MSYQHQRNPRRTPRRQSYQHAGAARLFVGQIGQKETKESLHAIFAPYGNIVEVDMVFKKDVFQCASFISYDSVEEADAAIAAIHGRYHCKDSSRPLHVQYAKNSQKISDRGLQHSVEMNRQYPSNPLFQESSAHASPREMSDGDNADGESTPVPMGTSYDYSEYPTAGYDPRAYNGYDYSSYYGSSYDATYGYDYGHTSSGPCTCHSCPPDATTSAGAGTPAPVQSVYNPPTTYAPPTGYESAAGFDTVYTTGYSYSS